MTKMMLSTEEVEHVATLSRLNLTDEEKQAMCQDLSNMVNYFGKLSEVDTTNVKDVNVNYGALREDVEEESLAQAEVLKNAPSKNDAYFVVPRVVD